MRGNFPIVEDVIVKIDDTVTLYAVKVMMICRIGIKASSLGESFDDVYHANF
jgi:hypothetical protein